MNEYNHLVILVHGHEWKNRLIICDLSEWFHLSIELRV